MTYLPNTLTSDLHSIQSILMDAGAVCKGTAVLCPFHQDDNPSGSIYVNETGKYRYHCHGPCILDQDILGLFEMLHPELNKNEAIKALKDKFPNHAWNNEPSPMNKSDLIFTSRDHTITSIAVRNMTLFAEYDYFHQDGSPAFTVLRFESLDHKKQFRVISEKNGHWIFGQRAGTTKKPLYFGKSDKHLSPSDDPVLIVEGEKKVDILTSNGFTSCTSAYGAKAARMSDWSPLAGRKIHIIRDKDAPGLHYAQSVKAELLKQGAKESNISIVPLAILDHFLGSDCNDVADLHKKIPEPEFVKKIMDLVAYNRNTSPSMDKITSLLLPNHHIHQVSHSMSSEPVSDYIDYMAQGIVTAIDDTKIMPWSGINKRTNGLSRGSLTTLAAETGVGKSILSLHIAKNCIKNGIPFLYYFSEGSLENAIIRLISIEKGTPVDTSGNNINTIKEVFTPHLHLINAARKSFVRIDVTSVSDLSSVIFSACQEKMPRLIIIDSISTILGSTIYRYKEEEKLIKDLLSLDTSLFVTSHFSKLTGYRSVKSPRITDDIAGSACISRSATNIFTLNRNKNDEILLGILKSGNGTGTGYKVNLGTNLFSLKEQGEPFLVQMGKKAG